MYICYEKELKNRIATRHYYLKVAKDSYRKGDFENMEHFSILAEREQESLETFEAWHPGVFV